MADQKKPIHVECLMRFTITDEEALRAYAIKVATERGELEFFLGSDKNSRVDDEEDGETYTPALHDLDYLLTSNPIQHGVPDSERKGAGVEWHGSKMVPLESMPERIWHPSTPLYPEGK